MTTRGRLGALLATAIALTVGGVLLTIFSPIAALVVLGAGLILAGGFVLLVVSAVWIFLARSRPRLDGALALAGLSAEVSITRDVRGTPHISATNEPDATFGLGVVMAQDRLWQMDLLRRAAAGRLAEVAGAGAVELDSYARTIGLRRIAEAEASALGGEERAILDAFAAGVNAVIDGQAGRLPAFEFSVLRYAPDRWSVVDSLAVAKALGWLLSSSLEASLLAWRLTNRLGPDVAGALIGPHPRRVAPPGGETLAEGVANLEREYRDAVGGGGRGGASNVWMLAGRHTRSGAPLLANDIHLGMDYTIQLYEARVAGGSLDVGGLFLPGAPLAVAGTNARIAWGATNTGAVVSEVYIEELSEDGRSTRHGDGWEPLREVAEEIGVRGGASRRLTVRSSPHGPLVSDLVRSIPAGERRAIALRWAGAEGGSPAGALLGIARASDWESFNAACDGWTVPAITFGYAGHDGHIGLRVAGVLPRRPMLGVLPLDGRDPANEWDGYHPPSANPREADPQTGWLASANNPPQGDGAEIATWLPEPPYRRRRIEQLIETFVGRGRPVSVEEMAQIQQDTISLHALELLPSMLARLDGAELTPRETSARRHLDDWNGNVTVESVAAAIWEVWYQRWLVALLTERLEAAEVALALDVPRLNAGDMPWSLGDRTELGAWLSRTRADELARQAFAEAIAHLEKSHGRDESDWDWGGLHSVTWAHPAARARPVAWLLNRGPFAAAGDGMTVNAAEFRLTQPYGAALVPVGRLLVDMGEGSRPRFSTHPGQSRHPLSRHYDDRIGEFRRAGTHVTPAELPQADALHRLTLRPR